MKNNAPVFCRSFALLIFLLVFSGFMGGYAQEAMPSWAQSGDSYEEGQGRGLSINTVPRGARVYIDGVERGTTPLKLENLRPGDYFIRLVKDGYRERRFRVTLNHGSFVNISLVMEEARGRVYVQIQQAQSVPSLPFNPRLFIDGNEAGSLSLNLPEGRRTITARAFGFEDETVTVYVAEDSVQRVNFVLRPAVFRLNSVSVNRKIFNPANSGALGTTELGFEVTAPGYGSLVIRNSYGEVVYTRDVGPFNTWTQSFRWDGRDSMGYPLPDGSYVIALSVRSVRTDTPNEEGRSLEVIIDSSRIIRPLTLLTAKSGLLFAPLPDLLPPGSFQVEAGMLYGNPADSGAPWSSLPFAGAFRLSAMRSLEIAAAFGMVPVFDAGAELAFGGSLKWVFLNPSVTGRNRNPALGLALGTVFSWVENADVTPFGMGSGIEVFAPFSLGFGRYSLHLAPALLWTGDNGFPWDGAPRLLVSGGFMFNGPGIMAGVSARQEFKFGTKHSQFGGRLLLGGEVKIFLPPSNLVYSLSGGTWIKTGAFGPSYGFFGGAGFGMIH